MAFPPCYTMNFSRFGEHIEPPNGQYQSINLRDTRSIMFPVPQPMTSLLSQVLFPTALIPPTPTSPALVSDLGPIVQNCDRTEGMNQRDTFYVFLKFLLRVLQSHGCGDDADARLLLRLRTKAIIRECVRQNRSGNSMYQPLMEAIKSRLRPIVGEDTWKKAHRSCRLYLRQKMNSLRSQKQMKPRVSVFTAV
jgi:hypothetical protein